MRCFKYAEIKELKSTETKAKYENDVSSNSNYQQRDRNYKINGIEIMELKSTITETKNSLEGLDNKISRQKKELMNLKIGQLRLFFNLRSRKKKRKMNRASETSWTQ